MLQIKHKRTLLFAIISLVFLTSVKGQKREHYEFYKDFPVYADKLLGELTYPMAWGNNKETDFDKWKAKAVIRFLNV